MKIQVNCSKCGKEHFFDITDDQYKKLRSGEGLIQNVLPDLTPDQRELFISGICSECFDEMFDEEVLGES